MELTSQLFRKHKKQVMQKAFRMSRGLPGIYDEYLSDGCLILFKAAQNFNPDMGVEFSTYLHESLRALERKRDSRSKVCQIDKANISIFSEKSENQTYEEILGGEDPRFAELEFLDQMKFDNPIMGELFLDISEGELQGQKLSRRVLKSWGKKRNIKIARMLNMKAMLERRLIESRGL